jgi:hypothetical protein
VLGYGVRWDDTGTKLNVLIERLLQDDIDGDTVVVFVDAFDVVFVHPLPVLLDKFRAVGLPIVVGAECECALSVLA